jgi:hypothetical protein
VEIPVVQRDFVEVTGVVREDKQAKVEFSWKRVLTDDGRALQKAGMTFDPSHDPSGMYSFDLGSVSQGAAELALYDDGWRVTNVTGM